MLFCVGPFPFKVRVVTDRPMDSEGATADELTLFDEQEVLIWAGLSPARRENVLFHGLRHVWRWYYGEAVGMEPDCDSSAAWAQWLLQGYSDQGGREALARMTPTGADDADRIDE